MRGDRGLSFVGLQRVIIIMAIIITVELIMIMRRSGEGRGGNRGDVWDLFGP